MTGRPYGRRAAIERASGPVVTPRSSSRPSTRRTNRSPRAAQDSAAAAYRRSRWASRVAAVRRAGGPSPASSASCSRTTSTYAVTSFWAPSRAVTKKGTIRTPGGGLRANQDRRAVLPAQASARHQVYAGPESARQKASSSANSPSLSTSSEGAILRTCSWYPERTTAGSGNPMRLPSPITTTPVPFSTVTGRSPPARSMHPT